MSVRTQPEAALAPLSPVATFRRRWCGIALIAAGVLITAGELTTPAGSTGNTTEQINAFVDAPAMTQLSAVLFHFGYLLVIPGIVGMLGLTRLHATRMSHAGAVLAFVGFASLAGNAVLDLVTLSAGQELGTEAAAEYLDATQSLGGALPFIIPAFLGSFLGLALLVIALGRTGEVAWVWVAVTIVGLVFVVVAPLHAGTVAGFVATSTGLAACGARLVRG
jgi:hypothetical protein